jgi:hypothetical protein
LTRAGGRRSRRRRRISPEADRSAEAHDGAGAHRRQCLVLVEHDAGDALDLNAPASVVDRRAFEPAALRGADAALEFWHGYARPALRPALPGPPAMTRRCGGLPGASSAARNARGTVARVGLSPSCAISRMAFA